MVILSLHPINCINLVLSETSERGGVRPHHGGLGEAGRCSQHPAQRGGGLQLAALHQLCRQQGEKTWKHIYMIFTNIYFFCPDGKLFPAAYMLLSCLLGEIYRPEKAIQQSTGELCCFICIFWP